MIIFIVTGIIDYILMAIIVGIAFYALFGHQMKMPPFSQKKYLLAFFCIFAVLDTYWIPAILSLDATATIGNKQLAEFLDLKGEFNVSKILEIGWVDFIIWIIQAVIAHFIGSRVYQRLVSRLTSTNTG
jgi:hypothetical protein